MTSWSNFGSLEDDNKKKFEGESFKCPKCKIIHKFSSLLIWVVPSGYDYTCPNCGSWIMVAEDIADGVFTNIVL